MSPLFATLLITLLLCGAFYLTWFIGRHVEKWSIVDAVWSYSICFNVLLFALVVDGGNETRIWLVALFVSIQSIRLGTHIAKRLGREKEDDPRYVEFARGWGSDANSRMLRFFQFQALGSIGLSLSIFAAMMSPRPEIGWLDYLGIGWMLVCILGEALADWQLTRFKKDPQNKGQVCKQGLWRYSRHPNYFFEWAFWLSFIPIGIGYGYFWLTPISACLMFYFLVLTTGIPPTEKQAIKSKGEAYRQYQKETSAFIPWIPKIKHI